jgi:hypothetical protein
MKKDLRDYIKIYKNVIDKTTCDQLVKELQCVEWQTHTFYYPKENKNASHEKELSSYYGFIESGPIIKDKIWQVLEKYILEDIKFPWFNGWEGFQSIKFNKYDKNTRMTEHCDHIKDLFDGEKKGIPILTIIGLLNKDFSHGEFVMLEDEIINLEPGDIVVFPSLFLYPHRVNEVLEGTRYSFASWAW